MSSYFDILSWTRARNNREALEKTNPQTPVLNEDDESFLHKITSQEAPAPPLPELAPMAINDDGEEVEATRAQQEAAEMILPSSPQPVEGDHPDSKNEKEDANDGQAKRTWASYIPALPSLTTKKAKPAGDKYLSTDQSKDAEVSDGTKTEDQTESEAIESSKQEQPQKAEESSEKVAEEAEKEAKETVEVAGKEDTRDEGASGEKADEGRADDTKETSKSAPQVNQEEAPKDDDKQTNEPDTEIEEKAEEPVDSVPEPEKDSAKESVKESVEAQPASKTAEVEAAEATNPEAENEGEAEKKDDEKPDQATQRTWASYIPAMPSLGMGTKNKDPSEVADAAQSSASQEDNEREVSVLLDNLNLSAINNRVFSFSQESQKIYQSFTLILKDMVNGVPTAYDDLDTLIKENEKHLEQMFGNMPPFVKTLVKSLPAKFMGSMGPEIMAAAGDKPGNDLKARMEAASRPGASAATTASNLSFDAKKKQKRKVPGTRDLVEKKGAVASMLSNILNFLKVRFPAFVTGTNVLMSMAVFILLFVFWYCHKRGRETRLLKASESAKGSANVSEVEDEESDIEDEKFESEDVANQEVEEGGGAAEAEKADTAVPDNDSAAAAQAQKILDQPAPAEVPLPNKKEEQESQESGLEKA